MVRIVTCNVNGLRNKMTRFTVFRELKRQKIDLCFLPETFVTNDVVNDFKKEWRGELLHVSGTPNSLGDIILLKRKFCL